MAAMEVPQKPMAVLPARRAQQLVAAREGAVFGCCAHLQHDLRGQWVQVPYVQRLTLGACALHPARWGGPRLRIVCDDSRRPVSVLLLIWLSDFIFDDIFDDEKNAAPTDAGMSQM